MSDNLKFILKIKAHFNYRTSQSRINIVGLFLSVYFSVRLSNFLCLSGLADERPREGVCGQRLRDLQHATGAAEVINQARGEEAEFKRKKRGMKTEMI